MYDMNFKVKKIPLTSPFIKGGKRGIKLQSAGITPGKLNPIVVEVMKEIGIDISGNKTKGVKEFIDIGNTFDYVITVCDESGCPLLPGNVKQMHWSFPDPSGFTGPDEEKLAKTREVRVLIKSKIEDWIKNFKEV